MYRLYQRLFTNPLLTNPILVAEIEICPLLTPWTKTYGAAFAVDSEQI